jgi:hypothetical protein
MAKHRVGVDTRYPDGGRRVERTFTDTWYWDDATDTITVEEVEAIENFPHRGQFEEHIRSRLVREVAFTDAPEKVRDAIKKLRT